MLTKDELTRYDRQMMISGFGRKGQEKLKRTTVFVAGAGGLGSPVSIYLAVAGIGNLKIVDNDEVELSNLNRQVLHWNKDIGKEKSLSAKEKISQINPDVKIDATCETISEGNVFELVGGCDMIVDAMDNFPTRYLLNRAAIEKKIPFFHGGIYGFEGRAMTIIPGETACLRCIFPKAPPKETFPVIGVAPGVIGCIQVSEVVKYVVGIGELLKDRLLIYDGLSSRFTEIKIKRDQKCVDCGSG
ncbi:MAG: HesA/MoeB/ThiF family protein [Halobacteriota archaeon]|nr:HesA/MoeB/ThiF family protein [Halobacteriota archaeon]